MSDQLSFPSEQRAAAKLEFARALKGALKRAQHYARAEDDQTGRARLRELSVPNMARRLNVGPSSMYAYLSGATLPLDESLDTLLALFRTRPAECQQIRRLHLVASGTSALPESGVVVPRQLPPRPPEMVARDEELQGLDQLHSGRSSGQVVVVSSVSGMPGVGKSALVTEWGYRRRRRFTDGELYVNLRGFDPEGPADPLNVLSDFLAALGFGGTMPESLDGRSALFRSLVERRKLLVLLDNARDAEQVRPLLPGSSRCTTIVTSRDALSGLVAVEGIHRMQLDVLDLTSSVRLLRLLIGSRADDDSAVAELAQRCGRLPLALRIAAELVSLRSRSALSELVRDLARWQDRIEVLQLDGDPRAAFRTVFSWSYGNLSKESQRMFRMTGLSPGRNHDGYGLSALLGIDPQSAQSTARDLIRANLLDEVTLNRFQSHDLLRSYGRELSLAQDLVVHRNQAVQRLGGYYASTAEVALQGLRFPREANRPASVGRFADGLVSESTWLKAERDNIVALALDWSDHDAGQVAVDLGASLGRYLLTTGHASQALALHEAGAAAGTVMEREDLEAGCLDGVAFALLQLGDAHRATATCDRALGVLEHRTDPEVEMRLLLTRASCLHRQGRFEEALSDLSAANRLASSDEERAALVFPLLGTVYECLGRYDHAREAYESALMPLGSSSDASLSSRILNNLGGLEYRVGNYAAALRAFEHAAVAERVCDDFVGLAHSRANAGICRFRLGKTGGRARRTGRRSGGCSGDRRHKWPDRGLEHAGRHAAGTADAGGYQTSPGSPVAGGAQL